MSKFIEIPMEDNNSFQLLNTKFVKQVFFEAGLKNPSILIYLAKQDRGIEVVFGTDEEALAFIEKYFPTK